MNRSKLSLKVVLLAGVSDWPRQQPWAGPNQLLHNIIITALRLRSTIRAMAARYRVQSMSRTITGITGTLIITEATDLITEAGTATSTTVWVAASRMISAASVMAEALLTATAVLVMAWRGASVMAGAAATASPGRY